MSGRWAAFAREFYAGGWRVVVASAFGYGLGVSVLPFYTLGSFVKPLELTYGWSRAQVQGCLGFVVAATLIGAWGTGWLTDRFGARTIASWSQVALGIGLLLLGLAPRYLSYWYAVWFLMTLSGLGTSPITWTRSVAGSFNEGRGLALALALCGSGVSSLVTPTLATLIIESSGWRAAYYFQAALVIFLALPITLLILPRRRTSAMRAEPATPPQTEVSGTSVSEALWSWRFWVLSASLMMIGFAISGLIPNLVPMMVERGIQPATASTLMGVLGLSILAGRLITGAAFDRVWAPAVACLVLPLPALSCVLLAHGIKDYPTVASCVGLLGFATGAEFDLAPYLVTRYFGMSRYSQIYALQWIAFTIAAGAAPPIVAHAFDVSGSYVTPLYFAAAFFLLAPLMLLSLGRYPRFAVSTQTQCDREPSRHSARSPARRRPF